MTTIIFTQAYLSVGLMWTVCHSQEIVDVAKKSSMPALCVSVSAIINTLVWPVAMIWHTIKVAQTEEL